MNRPDYPVRCCRCRFEHMESERVEKPSHKAKPGMLTMNELTCPACGAKTFYELREQVAWCWASGLIEIGDELPADAPDGGDAIEIARGPKYALKAQLDVVARHGKGQSAGCLLVPGVPEASSQKEKGDALATWLGWCGKRKPRDGVSFSREKP